MNFDLKLQILSNPSPTSSGHIDYGGWVTSPEWTTLERLNKPCLTDHMGEDQLDGPERGGQTTFGRTYTCWEPMSKDGELQQPTGEDGDVSSGRPGTTRVRGPRSEWGSEWVTNSFKISTFQFDLKGVCHVFGCFWDSWWKKIFIKIQTDRYYCRHGACYIWWNIG